MPAIDRLRDRFDLRRLVMVGDRGMISSEAIEALRDEPGVGWISALKSASIRSLIKQGHLQLDLFDERNLFEFARWTSVTPPFASGVTPRASPPRPRSTGFTSSAPRSHPMTWTPPSACDDTSPLAQPGFSQSFSGLSPDSPVGKSDAGV